MKSQDEVFAALRAELAALLRAQGFSEADIAPHTSLVDLGVSSMVIIDLTVALERRLGIDELPIQRWQDEQQIVPEPRYTVRSLVELCVMALQAQQAAGGAR